METNEQFRIERIEPMTSRFYRQGFSGVVVLPKQSRKLPEITLYVSKWNGETEWIIDGRLINGLPDYYNGEGSRVTLLHPVKSPTISRELDERVRQQTGW